MPDNPLLGRFPSDSPTELWLRAVTDQMNRDAQARAEGVFAPPRPRNFWEKVSDVFTGNVQTGETAIGRAMGEYYQGAQTKQETNALPALRFETLTEKPGVKSALAKTATSLTTAPALVTLPMFGGPLSALFKTTVGRLLSAGVGIEMIKHAYDRLPEFKQAVDAGEAGRAREILTEAGIDVIGGAGGLFTAVAGARIPSISNWRASEETAATLSRAQRALDAATDPMERERLRIQIAQLAEKARGLEGTPSAVAPSLDAAFEVAPAPPSNPAEQELVALAERQRAMGAAPSAATEEVAATRPLPVTTPPPVQVPRPQILPPPLPVAPRAQARELATAAGRVEAAAAPVAPELPQTVFEPIPAPGGGMTTLRPHTAESGFLRLPNPTTWYREQKARWIDELSPIEDLERLSRTPLSESAYNAARLYAGHFGKVVAEEREMRRILRPVAKADLLPDLDRFFELERHAELFRRPDLALTYETPGNMTLAQVDAELAAMRARLGPDRMAIIENAALGMRNPGYTGVADKLLQGFADSGLISQEALTAIRDANHHYAPLMRTAYLPDIDDRIRIGSRSFNVREQNVVRNIHGSTLEALPATEAFLRNVYRGIPLQGRNEVVSRIGRMADQPEYHGIVRRLRGNMQKRDGEGVITGYIDGVKGAWAVPQPVADAVTGMSVRDVDTLSQWVRGINRFMIEGSTRFYLPFIAKNIWRDYQTATLRSSELGLFKFTPLDWLAGFASAIGRDKWFDLYLRSGAAFSGFFERQASTAELLTRIRRGESITDKNRTVREQLARITEPEWKHVARGLYPWELMRRVAETSELAPRIGYTKMMWKAGRPMEAVGLASRMATADFARSGYIMKRVNNWVPFLNARKEGFLTTSAAIRNNPGRAAAVLGVFVGLPQMWTYLHNVTEYPDVWDDLRDSEKWQNFIDIQGREKDEQGNYTNIYKVPKGDTGRYFGGVIEQFLEFGRRIDPKGFAELARKLMMHETTDEDRQRDAEAALTAKTFSQLWKERGPAFGLQLLSDMSPLEFARDGRLSWETLVSGVAPPIAKDIIEPIANRNLYTMRQIETDEMKGVKPWSRYTLDTPDWIKAVTRHLPDSLGVSPVRLQNFIITQFGGVGRLIAADNPPPGVDRNPWLERTGVGQTIRAFSGARGGGIEEDRSRRSLEREVEVGTADYQKKLAALKLFRDVMAAPFEKRDGVVQNFIKANPESAIDPRTWEWFVAGMIAKKRNMTPYEKRQDAISIEKRATNLVEELDQFTNMDERARFMQRFYEIGVLTPEVARKMAEMYLKRGGPHFPEDDRTALDKAMGVPMKQTTKPLPYPRSPLDDALGVPNSSPQQKAAPKPLPYPRSPLDDALGVPK